MAATSAIVRTSAAALAAGAIVVGGWLPHAHGDRARAADLTVSPPVCVPTGDGFTAIDDEQPASRPAGSRSGSSSTADRRAGSLRPRGAAPHVAASRPLGAKDPRSIRAVHASVDILASGGRQPPESASADRSWIAQGADAPRSPVNSKEISPAPSPRKPWVGGVFDPGVGRVEVPPAPAANVQLAPAPVEESWQEVGPALPTAPVSPFPPQPLPQPLPPGPPAAPFPLDPGLDPGLGPALPLEPEPAPGGPMPKGIVEPMFGPMLDGMWPGNRVIDDVILCEDCQGSPRELRSPWRRLFDFGVEDTNREPGIGEERVQFAQFEVDYSQPMNNNRLRVDLAYGLPVPDRSEFFWSRIGVTGPKYAERSVDYQDLRFQMEFAEGKLFSIFTELPIRAIDPEINGNTAGFGDMVVGNRAVMIDGKYWQLTQILRTYINTGDFQRGLGTGHVSLEPGLVLRYRWNCKTYLHGEFKYLTPLGGDPMAKGDVLTYGLSIATVAYESDKFAVLPSLEFVGHTFLSGLKTLPPPAPAPFVIGPGGVPVPVPLGGTPPFLGRTINVDGEDFVSILGGVRLVLGPKGDLGLFEVGANAGIAPDNDATYDFLGRFEIRWSY